MGLLRQEDLWVDVVRTEQGCVAEFWHTRVATRHCVPLAEMQRGKLEFVRALLRAITVDLDEASKLSPEAAELVQTTRNSSSATLAERLDGTERDDLLIALFELERRGEVVPRERLYANRHAMADAAIRTYLVEILR